MRKSAVKGECKITRLRNRKWKGEDVSFRASVADRPSDVNRRCTDPFCCFLFVVYIIAMVVGSIYSVQHGEVKRITAPIDPDGNLCGLTLGYEDVPNLYISDIVNATLHPTDVFLHGVCVKECPCIDTREYECKENSRVSNCTISDADAYTSV